MISSTISITFVTANLNYRHITSISDVQMGPEYMITKNKYVTVSTEKIMFTGGVITSLGKPKGKYFIIKLEDGYVLALLPLNTKDHVENYTFNGTITPLDETDLDLIKYNSFSDFIDSELSVNWIIKSFEYNATAEGDMIISIIFTVPLGITTLKYWLKYKKSRTL